MLVHRLILLLAILVAASVVTGRGVADETTWKAGVSRVVITPNESMWMAGYASRKKPSEGTAQELYAKALAIEDAEGHRLIIVTTDLISIPRTLRDWTENYVQEHYKLPADALLMNASHTHCGPELRVAKASLYGVDEARAAQSSAYFELLKTKLAEVVDQAIISLQPAKVSYTHGRAGFAMNRRLPTTGEPRNAPYPDGPVDHDVPVLKVESPDGQLKVLLFGYACHNTTLSFLKFCGDYAGYAQVELENSFPGVTAMFITGCGGDQNPQPRGTIELAEHHGSTLATGVKAGLLGPAVPLTGTLRSTLKQVDLEFAGAPSEAELEMMQQSSNPITQRRAAVLMQELQENGSIRSTYPYMIQVVSFGNQLLLTALAGEVVVDYSLRIKREHAARGMHVWVAGYSNDVFGYVPSLRVLREGGYEGGGAMQFTTLPGSFAANIEERIMQTIATAVDEVTK